MEGRLWFSPSMLLRLRRKTSFPKRRQSSQEENPVKLPRNDCTLGTEGLVHIWNFTKNIDGLKHWQRFFNATLETGKIIKSLATYLPSEISDWGDNVFTFFHIFWNYRIIDQLTITNGISNAGMLGFIYQFLTRW